MSLTLGYLAPALGLESGAHLQHHPQGDVAQPHQAGTSFPELCYVTTAASALTQLWNADWADLPSSHSQLRSIFCLQGIHCRKSGLQRVSSRPKLTGIVRGKAFLHVLRRRPIDLPRLTQMYPIMPDVMDCDRERH
ncbi:hypothetical protein TNCV_2549061 [Trichonephila clavipes]|nr:hypothetical protein TNCV_2549061 [Trichonephila clavipes]